MGRERDRIEGGDRVNEIIGRGRTTARSRERMVRTPNASVVGCEGRGDGYTEVGEIVGRCIYQHS